MFLIFIMMNILPGIYQSSTESNGNSNKVIEYINGTRGIISSPNYPEYYPADVEYTWILGLGEIKTYLVFTIQDMDISWSTPCADYLKIRKTDPCCRTVFKQCGTFSGDISTKGREFRVSFVTDHARSGKGFNLHWKVTGTMKSFGQQTTETAMMLSHALTERVNLTDILASNKDFFGPTTVQSLTDGFGYTGISSTKKSPVFFETLLASPLIYGIGFFSLFGIILLLLVLILVSIVCKRRRRDRQSKQIYFCALNDKLSMHAEVKKPAQREKGYPYGQSAEYDEPAGNDYMELSNVDKPYQAK